MFGYWNKFIDIDLTSSKIKIVSFDEEILRKYIGGRGLASWILLKELGSEWERVNPLGPENLLLILTGPLTGYYPGIKLAISGKSPQSNGIVGSAISSEAALELRTSGYDGIIIRGEAEKPVYILIVNDHVEIKDAKNMWGLTSSKLINYVIKHIYPEIRDNIVKEKNIKEPSMIYIGPAGERKVRIAAVMSKITHAAGYGGYGAVMGSKKVKAIIVKGTGPLPPVKDSNKFKSMLMNLWRELSSRVNLRYWGTTAGIYEVGKSISSEPVRNWQEEWHEDEKVSVHNFECGVWVKRFWADYGCPTACMKLSKIKSGKNILLTDGPDYEMGAYLGVNLGIFNPEEIAYLSALADELGLDGINVGNVMGFAAELYEKGILGKEDIGFDVVWGDVNAFSKLMNIITYRKGLGDVLAEGTYRAALKISYMKGINVLKYAVHVKGIAVGAHGVRSEKDYTNVFSYAPSVQGGDHTSTAQIPLEKGELEAIFYDSAVVCMFNGIKFEQLIEFYNTITGGSLTPEKWFKENGLRILHIQRTLLLLGGPDVYWDPRIHDDNPPRFYEPLPTGPYAGKHINKDYVKKKVMEYYKLVGYDVYGLPRKDVLTKLGLEELDKLLERVRSRLKL